MRDLMNRLHLVTAMAPVAAIADNTPIVSAVCDLKGFGSCMLALVTGTDADADATFTVLIEDSDDNVTFAAVDDAYLDGTEVLASYNFADDAECRSRLLCGTHRMTRSRRRSA
jgi:hypothetical protein